MPSRRKIAICAESGWKELLQELATTELATNLPVDVAEVLHHGLQERQKRSSATLLRNKLSQLTLKREYQKI